MHKKPHETGDHEEAGGGLASLLADHELTTLLQDSEVSVVYARWLEWAEPQYDYLDEGHIMEEHL